MTVAIRWPLAAALVLTACQGGADGGDGPAPAFDEIAPQDTVRFSGTEPFWSGEVTGLTARYSTPENVDGTKFAVTRFAGLNGVSFSGQLDGAAFDLMVTPNTCSDGMSDRVYPYAAILRIGDEEREGCAWTDRQPFSGATQP